MLLLTPPRAQKLAEAALAAAEAKRDERLRKELDQQAHERARDLCGDPPDENG